MAWGPEFYDITYRYAEWIREKVPSIDEAVSKFTNGLADLLDNLSVIEWIACVPLERIFRQFPEFTDFGKFAILNAAASAPASDAELLRTFKRILAEQFSINFMASEEIRNSYHRLDHHYLKKSGHYIPGRPLLVIKTGRGEPRANMLSLHAKLGEVIPLLQLCQLVISLEPSLSQMVIGGHSTRPDGKFMQSGLISIPQVAVAMNKRTGEADWWVTRFKQFETEVGCHWAKDTTPLDLWRFGIQLRALSLIFARLASAAR